MIMTADFPISFPWWQICGNYSDGKTIVFFQYLVQGWPTQKTDEKQPKFRKIGGF
jgi:hypothetical protein